MSSPEERATLRELIGEATTAGARQARACAVLGLSARTVQRWQGGGPEAVDGRTLRHHDAVHKLSTDERAELLAVANSVEFGHLPPSQIVPRLADQGRYIASESTFYRVLREEKQLAHRRSERPARARSKPRAVCADGPISCSVGILLTCRRQFAGSNRGDSPLVPTLPVHLCCAHVWQVPCF
jgi:putative transposase